MAAPAVNMSEVAAQQDVSAQQGIASETVVAGASAAQPNSGTPVNTSEAAAIAVTQDQVLQSQ